MPDNSKSHADEIDALAEHIAWRVMDRIELDGGIARDRIAEEVRLVLSSYAAAEAIGATKVRISTEAIIRAPHIAVPSIGPRYDIDSIRAADGKNYWDIVEERLRAADDTE